MWVIGDVHDHMLYRNRFVSCVVRKSVLLCRKWHDDYYYMLEKEFGKERTRLVAESMTCGCIWVGFWEWDRCLGVAFATET